MINTFQTNMEFLKNRRSLIVSTIILLLLTFIPDMLIRLGIESETSRLLLFSKGIRTILLVLVSVSLATYRGFHVNPLLNKQYRQWLVLLPWNVRSPLPAGSVHITLPDYVALFLMTIAAYLTFPKYTYVPVYIFSAIYLVCLCSSLYDRQRAIFIIVLFVLPTFFYCDKNHLLILITLFLIYALLKLGLFLTFKDFPWNSEFWNSDPIPEYKQNDLLEKRILPPYSVINAYEPLISFNRYKSFILTSLIVWWIQPAILAVNKLNDPQTLVFCIALMLAIYRTIRYVGVAAGFSAPINFLGRFFTGRWIIPRYDYVFLAPIMVIMIGYGLPVFLRHINLNNIWNFNISLFVTIFVTLTLPPSVKQWRLTGQHRVVELNKWNRKNFVRIDTTTLFVTRILIKLFR